VSGGLLEPPLRRCAQLIFPASALLGRPLVTPQFSFVLSIFSEPARDLNIGAHHLKVGTCGVSRFVIFRGVSTARAHTGRKGRCFGR
jgi:hypothetical protein